MQRETVDEALNLLIEWVETDFLIYGAAANVVSKAAGYRFNEFWNAAEQPRDVFLAQLRERLARLTRSQFRVLHGIATLNPQEPKP